MALPLSAIFTPDCRQGLQIFRRSATKGNNQRALSTF